MCGRFELSKTPLRRVAQIRGIELNSELAALDRRRFNIGPGQKIAYLFSEGRTAARDDGRVKIGVATWGITGSDGTQRINARVESLRPVWLGSRKRRRGVIPADGFIEWDRRGGRRRTPMHVRSTGGMLWLAAVIDEERDRSRPSPRGVIITCEATGSVEQLHHRMPLSFASWDHARCWMDTGRFDVDELKRQANAFEVIPISPKINAVDHDDPGCLVPVTDPPQLELFGARTRTKKE